jgi:hypothetical protein
MESIGEFPREKKKQWEEVVTRETMVTKNHHQTETDLQIIVEGIEERETSRIVMTMDLEM